MTLFITLVAIGVSFIVIELFVPGGIVGTVGGIALAAALVTSYVVFGTPIAHYVLLAMLIGAAIFLWWWLTIFPHSRFAGPVVMRETIDSPDHGLDHLVGHEGKALTSLRPAGMAELEGARVDVVTEGDFIDEGQPVRVVSVAGTRIVVRRVEA